jgi:hypothetical protein
MCNHVVRSITPTPFGGISRWARPWLLGVLASLLAGIAAPSAMAEPRDLLQGKKPVRSDGVKNVIRLTDGMLSNDGDEWLTDVDGDFPIVQASGQAATPPMGWNSWNKFSSNVNENLIKLTADGMVSSGMKDAGYTYVNIDDTWSLKDRAADGSLQADPVKFPNGIKALADYVHGKGLKLGIYGDRGTLTCAGFPGSLGHEAQDALTFAGWGIDYLKYDNCSADAATIQTDYTAMGTAIAAAMQATGQNIVFSLCAWQFYEWGLDISQLWRTTGNL